MVLSQSERKDDRNLVTAQGKTPKQKKQRIAVNDRKPGLSTVSFLGVLVLWLNNQAKERGRIS